MYRFQHYIVGFLLQLSVKNLFNDNPSKFKNLTQFKSLTCYNFRFLWGPQEDLKSFYKALHKTTVRLAGELEKYEQKIVDVNAILTRREEEKRLEGLIEGEQIGLEKGEQIGLEKGLTQGEQKAKRDLYLKKVARGKTDDQIMDEMEITQIELDALKSDIS